ncbi:MAG TPA: D-aminoacylase [Mycobacteriales bacterium]|nr:D-aminoacylase [Mycobacteriales bacterium]
MSAQLIRGGTVVDGTGAEPFRADVLIQDGTIAAVGPDLGAPDAAAIDATGRHVLPGFIDVHTHDDVALLKPGFLDPKLRQGVTTCVVGNCGHGPAPTTTEQLRQYSEPVLGAFPENSTWPAFADYLEALAAAPRTVNAASLVPHGPVRAAVCGADRQPATPAQIADICALIDDALSAGACGVSLGLIYQPGNAARQDELDAIGRAVAAHDKLLVSHIRNEGSRIDTALEEFTGIARRSSCRLHLSHLKLADRRQHGDMGRVIGRLEEYRSDGIDLTADVYPYTAGSTTVATLFPPWTLDGGISALLERLRDPVTRAKVAAELEQPWDELENHLYNFGAGAIRLAGFTQPQNRQYEGRSIADIAGDSSIPERIIDLVLEEKAALSIVVFQIDENDMRQALAWPWSVVGSDGLPLEGTSVHPRLYGTFPRVLARYADSLPGYGFTEAVRRMTSMAADRFGLTGRGRIAAGQAADLVIVDRAELADRATFDEPRQFPAGIAEVLVNGDSGGQLLRV